MMKDSVIAAGMISDTNADIFEAKHLADAAANSRSYRNISLHSVTAIPNQTDTHNLLANIARYAEAGDVQLHLARRDRQYLWKALLANPNLAAETWNHIARNAGGQITRLVDSPHNIITSALRSGGQLSILPVDLLAKVMSTFTGWGRNEQLIGVKPSCGAGLLDKLEEVNDWRGGYYHLLYIALQTTTEEEADAWLQARPDLTIVPPKELEVIWAAERLRRVRETNTDTPADYDQFWATITDYANHPKGSDTISLKGYVKFFECAGVVEAEEDQAVKLTPEMTDAIRRWAETKPELPRGDRALEMIAYSNKVDQTKSRDLPAITLANAWWINHDELLDILTNHADQLTGATAWTLIAAGRITVDEALSLLPPNQWTALTPGPEISPLIQEKFAEGAVTNVYRLSILCGDLNQHIDWLAANNLIDEEKIRRGIARQTLNNVNTLIANHQVFDNCLAELLRDTLGDNPRVWELAARLEDGWQRTLGELLETVQAINED